MSEGFLRWYGVVLGTLILAIIVLLYSSPFGAELERANVRQDWIQARALIAGDNPYADLAVLSARYTNSRYPPPVPDPWGPPQVARAPRTPGAVLLALPLAPVPHNAVVRLNALVQIGCLIAAFGIIYRKTRRPEIGLWLSATLVSVPFLWQMGWGNVGGTLSLLIVLSAALTQGHDSRRAGLFVGVAACTKAFPLILVGALAGHRRKKAVGYSVLSVAALNLPVLLFSAVSSTEALDAIIGAPKR